MKYSTLINGLPVEAEYRDSFLKEMALPLLREWTDLQRKKGERLIVFLAAAPGAGKSTLAQLLERLSKEREDLTDITALGMDGFHRDQDYLLTHELLRDGKMIPMVSVKGTPETFDLEALKERTLRLRTDESVPWPIYDRTTHNPREGELTASGDIILIEGNYLLLDLPGWRDLRALADDTVELRAEESLLKRRLLARKLNTQPDIVKAEEFVEFSDMYNVRLCLSHSVPARVTFRVEDLVPGEQ